MPPENMVASMYEGVLIQEPPLGKKSQCDTLQDSGGFKLSLYKNSNVYRIVLNNPVKTSKLYPDEWHRIDFKLVTEMGLPVAIRRASVTVNCRLLQRDAKQGYIESKALTVHYRTVVTDSWSIQEAIHQGSDAYTGCFEYKIVSQHCDYDPTFFLTIQTQEEQLSQHALALCLGPFELQTNPACQKERMAWDDVCGDVSIHRVLPLGDQHVLVLKEMWDNGTPGKLWDSSLVIGQILTRLFKSRPQFLCNLRIMDLSAGVGSLGLLISELYQVHQIPNPPSVVLTDIPEALPLIKHNLFLNSTQSHVQIKPLRWGQARDIERLSKRQPFDYLFVSDVLYNTEDFRSLVATFRLLCSHSTVLFLGYKPRGLQAHEEDFFFTHCAVHFDIQRLTLDRFEQELLGEYPPVDGLVDSLYGFTGVQLFKLVLKKEVTVAF
ncbi:putative methyltransferase-domain-containing protein [Sporodiniella umbellata]|nr:putative methyltransferase-domain-containing protein [Sporodiniella umbellata]